MVGFILQIIHLSQARYHQIMTVTWNKNNEATVTD